MRWRIVRRGESLVGYVRPASSGTQFSARSSSESFPSSRSLRIASAVKLLVIDAMRNTVPLSTGDVAVAGDADVRESPVDDDAPHRAGYVLALGVFPEHAVDVAEARRELRDAVGIREPGRRDARGFHRRLCGECSAPDERGSCDEC